MNAPSRRVHVLPCGTSILKNLETGGTRRSNPAFPRQVNALVAWAKRELRIDEPAATWRESFHQNAGPHLDLPRQWQQPADLSAEIASLVKLDPPVRPEDLVILLASDTWRGMLAALVNAAWLGRPVRVHTRPEVSERAEGQLLADRGSGEPVHVIRVPGLRAITTETFVSAQQEIAKAMLWAGQLQHRGGEDLVLHLAGGYKATLPYLVVLAEYLKGLCPPVRAVCLHEGDPDATEVPEPVEIHLRKAVIRDDLPILERVAKGETVDDTRLLGFAFTESNGRSSLTDLGKVLLSLRIFMQVSP